MRTWQGTAILIAAWLLLAIPASAQNITRDKVTLGLNDASLQTAIKSIEQQTTFRFFYRDDDIKAVIHLTLPEAQRTIEETLNLLLQNSNLSFRQLDNSIFLERREKPALYAITGKVVTAMDNMPVTDASVFLSNATIGIKTKADGSFSLQNIRPGKYVLVVSNVGFETNRVPVAIDNNDVGLPAIVMSPQTIILNEVRVTSRTDPDWQRNYDWFKTEFLGTSKRAAECRILNPELLDFNYNSDSNILTASSEDYLDVDNNALGYKIKYQVTNFIKQVGATGANDLEFGGPAFFREMRGTAAERKRWQKRRFEAYEGSLMHFLRSVLNNSYEQDGFRVLRIANTSNPERPPDSLIAEKIKSYQGLKHSGRKYRDSLAYWRAKQALPAIIHTLQPEPLKQEEIVRMTNQKGLFALDVGKNSLYVVFSKTHHFPSTNRIDNLNEPANDDRTIINFDAPFVLFDKNGCLMDPSCVSFEGAWGKYRVADLLPVDYDPYGIDTEDGNIKPIPVKGKEAMFNPLPASDLKSGLINLKRFADSVTAARSPEKSYLQLDKPWYMQGDTVWFKAYLVDGASLTAGDRSGILYADILNDSSRIVKSCSFPLAHGLTWGNIALGDKDFSPGKYTIRAYTNWMRNFESDYFFNKTFTVTSFRQKDWLVSNQISSDSNTVRVALHLNYLNKTPVANAPVHLEVFDGNKKLSGSTLQSDGTGLIDINVPFRAEKTHLTIVAADDKGNKKAVIPISINHYQNVDVQFLPEGGALVCGMPAHIGVKAIGEDGKSVDVSGVVFDDKHQEVTQFKTLHGGMGSFNLMTESEGTYTAEVTMPDGAQKNFTLPAVKSTGTVMLIKNNPQSESLDVSVGATNDIVQSGREFYLIAQARGVICYGAIISFKDGRFIRGPIPKNLFPTGVAHFTLMTEGDQPVCERALYIDHRDQMAIGVTPGRTEYLPGDGISLKLLATGPNGKALPGNFSIAVTDDSLVKQDTIHNETMMGRFLLTSEVKGYVEDPGYYFATSDPGRYEAIDNLLLTQGWVGYNWDQTFSPPVNKFAAEIEFMVSGNVITAFNKPSKGTHVTLFSRSPLILMDTVTNDAGRFVFNAFPRVDTPIFILKAVNKNGKSFNVVINIPDREPPVFVSNMPEPPQWNVNMDSALVRYIKTDRTLQETMSLKTTGHLLNEVKITAVKIVRGSKNLNGPGSADQVFDEKDMEHAGKKTFLDMLETRVKGFHEGYIPRTSIQWYFINEMPVVFVIDGIRLSVMYPDMRFLDLRYYLQTHTAEDLTGIEVMRSAKYAWTYASVYNQMPETHVYIELTTRGGHGPGINDMPGMYLYKPLALSCPRQFYKPKYQPGNNAADNTQDFRSTIDWEPNINTDVKGAAAVSFFAGSGPATYTYIIEGTDMNGNFGYKTGKIVVGKNNGIADTGSK